MKKTVLTFMTIFALYGLQAQSLEQGNGMINIGLGLSSYYTSGSGFTTTLPPLEGTYEVMISDKVSVGGFIGAFASKYENEYNNGSYSIDSKIKYNYLNIGGLANYHFVNDNSINVYAGARLGYVSSSAKTSIDTDLGSDHLNEEFKDKIVNTADGKASGILFGAHVGGRYFISDKMAIDAELGYGISVLKIGVTFKL